MASELRTDRLRLRPFLESDLDAMVAVLSDPVSMRFYPHPFDRDRTRWWIDRSLESYQRDGTGLLAVEELATGEVIGDCGPTVQEVDGSSFVELGWHIRRDRQGNGFATEAGVACRDDVFATSPPDRLISLIRPENVPSWRVAVALGFRPWRATVRQGMAHVVWSMGPDDVPPIPSRRSGRS